MTGQEVTYRELVGMVPIWACPCGAVWWPVTPTCWRLTHIPDPTCTHLGRTLRAGRIRQ